MMDALELSVWGTTTLGSLINALKRCNADADVEFDFCYLAPTKVNSYRGYYDHLALGWTDKHDGPGYWPKVSALIAELESAIGKTFTGYKGGEYRMNGSTPLWVANYGQTGGTGIVGLNCEGDMTVTLVTAKVD